ncbi:restriction endonuclease subunit S [Roseibium sediminicola]|uniref:Restriction endonuclease subunit S n=1 Tax=Roseibium sediminicola TaxID=2933272 RepID=A0ABT0GSF4_9HYPH|nr:restriction endonuclease subunit S [Roseibium sp. CAU 1639]MCK7612362.1 restriction endonuclease subunit S [Roseibium sp. CAU 1639]
MSVEVPSGWAEIRLKEICREIEVPVGSGPRLPLLSVTKGGVVPQSDTYGKEIASADVSRYKVIQPGQFAMAPMAMYYGAVGRFHGNSPGMISPAYNVFVHEAGVDPSYLEALIRLPRMVGRYEALSQGGNLEGKRKNTSFSDFGSIPVFIPPYAEQLAIAEVLQSVEDAIARKRELIGTLGESKKAVMRELLTKGIRRAGVPMKDLPERWVLGRVAEGIEQIPTDWKMVRLTSVAKLESGHTPDRKQAHYWEGDIPWISLQDADALTRNTISETAETIGPEGLKNSSARMLPTGTVVFQRTANVGRSSIMGREMCTSQHFANWVCGPKLVPGYLMQVFRHMQREWQRLMAGSVLPDIYMPPFKRLQILLPRKDEQEKIADVGEAFDRRIETEKRSLAELQNTRAALAQELLSGRLRLPAAMIARFENRQAEASKSEAVTA